MIRVVHDPGKGIELSGHAGYAEKGRDIVCAGVSAIYFMLLRAPGIDAYMQDGRRVLIGSTGDAAVWIDTAASVLETMAAKYDGYMTYVRGPVVCGGTPECDI